MTTQEFITKNFGVTSTKERKCSSVFADHNGNMYSYGYHYPLLFRVGELVFRNVTGYSNSTAKHINWARDQGAIDVWLSGCNQYSYRNSENSNKVPALLSNYASDKDVLKAVFADLEAELVDINTRIASKKRTDTKIYKALMSEHMDCVDRITSVRPYVGGK